MGSVWYSYEGFCIIQMMGNVCAGGEESVPAANTFLCWDIAVGPSLTTARRAK